MRSLALSIVPFLTCPAFGQVPEKITNSIGMDFALIRSGTFTMGSSLNEAGRQLDEAQCEVFISKPFYLGVYEVTQTQYAQVIGNNSSTFKGEKRPVERVDWNAAVLFCKNLSNLPQEKSAGRVYRLPTEAEWEYSCRAGSETEFSFGDSPDRLEEHAWLLLNANYETHPVGVKKPNRWGLFDMHGNVWEWCSDWYSSNYPSVTVTDPQGATDGRFHVLRGGSWNDIPSYCRSAVRRSEDAMIGTSNTGFRVVFSATLSQSGTDTRIRTETRSSTLSNSHEVIPKTLTLDSREN